MKNLLCAAIVAAAIAAPAAEAATTLTFTGDLTGAPTFARPGSGGGYHYRTHGFTVGETGAYDLTMIYTAGYFDTYLYLYQGSFDAANPNSNLIAADDDNGPIWRASKIAGINLSAGTSYYAVATSYSSGVQAPYQLTIEGANLSPIGGVPEPATWAMMIAGFGLVGSALRRRTAVAA